jgi:threonine dehydratase
MSANALGINATIVMPLATPQIKVDSVRRLGGERVEVVLHGENFDAASAEANRRVEKNNQTLIHPFNDPDVIAGQVSSSSKLPYCMKINVYVTLRCFLFLLYFTFYTGYNWS